MLTRINILGLKLKFCVCLFIFFQKVAILPEIAVVLLMILVATTATKAGILPGIVRTRARAMIATAAQTQICASLATKVVIYHVTVRNPRQNLATIVAKSDT
jgi:hypothetical protein